MNQTSNEVLIEMQMAQPAFSPQYAGEVVTIPAGQYRRWLEALREPPAQAVTLPTHEGWWWEWSEVFGQWLPVSVGMIHGVPHFDGKYNRPCKPGHWIQLAMPPKPAAQGAKE